MGQPISGKDQVAIIAGSAIVNLKGFTSSKTGSPIALDADITSTRISQIAGFLSESGTIAFNYQNETGEDFEDMWDAVNANASVSMYVYPGGAGASQIYMYGNVFLNEISVDVALQGTVSCNLSWVSSDNTGISRQRTAA